jgi:phosphoribosylglycinamide formyltransferase-1
MNLAVLLSGGGRTLQNLLDRCADGTLPARVALVVSNKPDAYGLERARAAYVPTMVVNNKEQPEPLFSYEIFRHCRNVKADLVCLAGFLQKLTVPPDFQGRVLNIHPALLPKFGGQGMYGHYVHEAVLKAGETESGCTVHVVTEEYDAGPIVYQQRVPVLPGDTPETLADRVFQAECEAYPQAILRMIGPMLMREFVS